VKGNDTLSSIARRYGLSVGEVIAANPQITNPNYIRSGWEVSVPQKGSISESAQQRGLNRMMERAVAATPTPTAGDVPVPEATAPSVGTGASYQGPGATVARGTGAHYQGLGSTKPPPAEDDFMSLGKYTERGWKPRWPGGGGDLAGMNVLERARTTARAAMGDRPYTTTRSTFTPYGESAYLPFGGALGRLAIKGFRTREVVGTGGGVSPGGPTSAVGVTGAAAGAAAGMGAAPGAFLLGSLAGYMGDISPYVYDVPPGAGGFGGYGGGFSRSVGYRGAAATRRAASGYGLINWRISVG